MKIDPPAGLYIHTPFCKTKCSYCDFFSQTDFTYVQRWKESVQKEYALYRDRFGVFNTLYIGGGTPSSIDAVDLEEIISFMRSGSLFKHGSEITVEMNPDDVTLELITKFKVMGVNRISLGIQSLDDDELGFLGRRHTADQGTQSIEVVRETGVENISVDLMYGLPDQTINMFLKTLKSILTYHPDHISCYQLTISEGTPFYDLKMSKSIPELTEKVQGRFFTEISKCLRSEGYLHYEVSNFAATREKQCCHNMKYWTRQAYLGLGPSAHSYYPEKRWWNVKDTYKYCTQVQTRNAPVKDKEDLTTEQINMEKLSLGFRTDQGVGLDDLAFKKNWESTLTRLVEDRFMEIQNKRAVPTTKGLLMADRLALEFV